MKRITKILEELYHSSKTKQELANLLNVETKTIENNILKYNNLNQNIDKEIIYDMNIRKYRFNTLLPSLVPSKIIYEYMANYINDTFLKKDYKHLIDYTANENNEKCIAILVNTYELSPLLQNIIKINISIKNNFSLEIDYIGNKGKNETKFIKPHNLYFNGYTHYLYASYHDDNILNIGEMRTFTLKGIKSIKIHNIENEILYQEVKGNAWGEFNNSIILDITGSTAKYFRRENIINSDQFNLISIEENNNLIIEMKYSSENDIVNLMQKWMPDISIHIKSDISQRIYQKIKDNYINFLLKEERKNI